LEGFLEGCGGVLLGLWGCDGAALDAPVALSLSIVMIFRLQPVFGEDHGSAEELSLLRQQLVRVCQGFQQGPALGDVADRLVCTGRFSSTPCLVAIMALHAPAVPNAAIVVAFVSAV